MHMIFTKVDFYIVLGTIAFLYGVGAWTKTLPSVGGVHQLVSMIDTKGGNILILGALMLYFFHRSEEMYYNVISLINDGKIASDNGIALNALTFTVGAFGAFSGALLKVMSGTEPARPTATTTVTSTNPPPVATPVVTPVVQEAPTTVSEAAPTQPANNG